MDLPQKLTAAEGGSLRSSGLDMLSESALKITELDQIFDEDEDSQQVREGLGGWWNECMLFLLLSLQSMESSPFPEADGAPGKGEQGEASKLAMVTVTRPPAPFLSSSLSSPSSSLLLLSLSRPPPQMPSPSLTSPEFTPLHLQWKHTMPDMMTSSKWLRRNR